MHRPPVETGCHSKEGMARRKDSQQDSRLTVVNSLDEQAIPMRLKGSRPSRPRGKCRPIRPTVDSLIHLSRSVHMAKIPILIIDSIPSTLITKIKIVRLTVANNLDKPVIPMRLRASLRTLPRMDSPIRLRDRCRIRPKTGSRRLRLQNPSGINRHPSRLCPCQRIKKGKTVRPIRMVRLRRRNGVCLFAS